MMVWCCESAAILISLAKKTEKLIPSDFVGESQVVRWCCAATNSVEMPLMSILMIDWYKDDRCRKHREAMVGWANRLLSGLERWLDRRQYVATDSFTVADILMSHVPAGITTVCSSRTAILGTIVIGVWRVRLGSTRSIATIRTWRPASCACGLTPRLEPTAQIQR